MQVKFNGNSIINADEIIIGNNFKIGNNVNITVRGKFIIGDNSTFGDDVHIKGEEVIIGDYFFHLTPNLRIGGGGSQFSDAKLKVGDRCVFHNNYINICKQVIIGNDVGLSPDVDIITHGFWNSVLEGYPIGYDSVKIGNGVIVGQRSFINVGAVINDNIVIGANSTVVGNLNKAKSVYAGSPAKFIRQIEELDEETKLNIFNDIMGKFKSLTKCSIRYGYPLVYLNGSIINVETKEITGEENIVTDMFRDHLRRFGIKIYTPRGFKSVE
jgi:acetyltransferase-like isoleucine patch superfamily enzyme